MRNIIFFVLSAIFAGIIVYFGINPISLAKSHSVLGRINGDLILFGPNEIEQFHGDNSFALTKAGQGSGSAIGLRMVSFKSFSKNPTDAISLQFAPNLTQRTKGHSLKIAIVAPPIPYKETSEFAIGLSDGQNVIWSNAIPKPETEAATIMIDTPRDGVKTLLINPDIKGSGKGIDIISIAIRVL